MSADTHNAESEKRTSAVWGEQTVTRHCCTGIHIQGPAVATVHYMQH